MANEPRNLYELEDFFRLFIDGVWKYVDEPIGWDKTSIKLTRDKDWYGLNYEFVEGEVVTLTFEWDVGGGDELRSIYEQTGSDSEVKLEYGYFQNGIPKIQFSGVLNFNDYQVQEDGIEISIQKTFFQSLLRTRYETKIDLTAAQSLDGAAITPPTPLGIKLHSKRIKKYGRAEVADPPATLTPVFGTDQKHFYIQPDTLNITKAEVEEMFSMPLGITEVTAPSELRFQFQPKEAGRMQIHWEFTYKIRIQPLPFADPIGDYSLVPVIHIYRGGVWYQTISPSSTRIDGTAGSVLEITHTFSIDYVIDAQVGDQFYFNVNGSMQYNSLRVISMTDVNGFIEILQETVAPTSKAKSYKLIDCFNQVVAAVTGAEDRVVSSFFGAGGCGEKFALTNGFQLRNFDIANRPVLASFKDLLEGCGPIWCSGIQYLTNGGIDVIRLEPVSEFFKGDRIWEFKEISSYTESHSKDMTWNEAEIGYQKYDEDNLNTLDEFNTYQIWLLPIKTYKAKYSKKSGFIAGGYSIEKMRREQFKDNPSTSLSNDDDLFIISYITERKHKDVAFTIQGSRLIVQKQINVLVGETLKINKVGGGPNDGTVFTVQTAQTIPGQDEYFIDPVPVFDSGLAEIEILITGPEAEKNEAFDIVDNLISPDTAYNLRISPLHMLFNHSIILNSCLEKKLDTDLIKNTFVKNNGQLITKFNPAAPCQLMDLNAALKETDPVQVQNFNTRRQLWRPQGANFKARMFYDDYIYIKERATGESGTSQDYGTIMWPDDKGNKWEGYIWSMEYDPVEEEVTVQVRKKRQI